MTIGERIKEIRKKKGLTQKQLGEALGVSYQTIAQWENNLRNPKHETLRKLAAALDLKWYELYPEEEQGEVIQSYMLDKLNRERPKFRKLSDSEAQKSGFLQFDSDTDRLSYFFSQLNDEGQTVAADRVQELTEIPKYKKIPPQD